MDSCILFITSELVWRCSIWEFSNTEMLMHQKKMSAGISRHINGTINASWSGNFLPVPAIRQVSWLTDHHTRPPSQSLRGSLSDCPVFFSDRAFAHGLVFPAHSDEIVQVFHLFPFYLLSVRFQDGSSTGCLFDCYGRYFNILVTIMQERNLKTETDAGHFRLLFSQSVNRNHFHKNIRRTGVESS